MDFRGRRKNLIEEFFDVGGASDALFRHLQSGHDFKVAHRLEINRIGDHGANRVVGQLLERHDVVTLHNLFADGLDQIDVDFGLRVQLNEIHLRQACDVAGHLAIAERCGRILGPLDDLG